MDLRIVTACHAPDLGTARIELLGRKALSVDPFLELAVARFPMLMKEGVVIVGRKAAELHFRVGCAGPGVSVLVFDSKGDFWRPEDASNGPYPSFESALAARIRVRDTRPVFVVGEQSLFEKAAKTGLFGRLHLAVKHGTADRCAAAYYGLNGWTVETIKTVDTAYGHVAHVGYVRSTKPAELDEASQYLSLVRQILTSGSECGDRTGTGTLRLFGQSMRFSLAGSALPILTTRRISWKTVLCELLWFLSGSTCVTDLQSKRVRIWDANYASRPGAKDGDLGPIYGFQWRHFGAAYSGVNADYAGKGVDQIRALVSGLEKDPYSRRHILSAWNPTQIAEMALPPCHVMAQFLVDKNSRLTCVLTQRSGDMGLGVPFNIASYAFLTHMIADQCGLTAHELVVTLGDAHVYFDHVEALLEQLQNSPIKAPMYVGPAQFTDILSLQEADISVHGYTYTPISAQMKMSV